MKLGKRNILCDPLTKVFGFNILKIIILSKNIALPENYSRTQKAIECSLVKSESFTIPFNIPSSAKAHSQKSWLTLRRCTTILPILSKDKTISKLKLPNISQEKYE